MDRFEKMRSESQTKIQRAAMRLFAEKGFNNSSISDIARSAGMAKGAIYHYFSSKEELLESLFKDSAAGMFAFYKELSSREPAINRLSNFLQAYALSLKTYESNWKLLSSLILQSEKKTMVSSIYKPYMIDFQVDVRAVFRELRFQNIHLEISFLITLLNGWQVSVAMDNSKDIQTEISHYINRLRAQKP